MNSPGEAQERDRARAWVTVDLDAITHNVQALRALLPPQTAFMAVVKADAYGHGAVPVARAALDAGAAWLGVATAEEALELRAAGLTAPVLILGPVPVPWLSAAAEAGCALTVADAAGLDAVAGLPGCTRLRVHIKVDTGMMRLGFAPEDLDQALSDAHRGGLAVEALFTHLASADETDTTATARQLELFSRALHLTRARFPGVIAHAAASAGVIGHPGAAFDMVRVGIALYGVPPAPHLPGPGLRPALTWQARVVRTRRVASGTPVSYGGTYRAPRATTIATISVGYGDGYPRALSNAGAMLTGGRRFPVAGRVCMDYTMLDVEDAPVLVGDEVTVLGPGLPAQEVAQAAGTIAHEVFCRIGRRIPRIYLRAEGHVAAAAGASAHPDPARPREGGVP
jgi:alanine racemase